MATCKAIYDPRRFVPTTSTDTDVAVPVTNASNLGFVALQPASPGTAQTGVANITKLLVGPVGDGTTPVAVTTDGANAATFGNGATTGGIQLFLSNASGNVIFGVIDSLNTFVSGGVAYAGFVGTNIGKPFYIISNGTAAIGIDTSQVATFVNPFKITGTGGANQVLKQTTSGGAVTVAALGSGDVPDVALTANVPLLNRNAQSFTGTYNEFVAVGVGTAPSPNSFFSGGKTVHVLDSGNLPNLRLQTNGGTDFSLGADSSSAYIYVAGAQPIRLCTNGTVRMAIDASGNVSINTGAVATTATDGFLYIPTCAGAPTGVPTAKTGLVPMVYDSTNNKMYVYNGAWKSATFA